MGRVGELICAGLITSTKKILWPTTKFFVGLNLVITFLEFFVRWKLMKLLVNCMKNELQPICR